LIYKKAVESFTSMKENVGVLQIENKVLRDWLSPVILTNTKCILYL
jgi:hypothetical protein